MNNLSCFSNRWFYCFVLMFISFGYVAALKYSTAVPVIFLSALKYHVIPDRWTHFYRPLWLLAGVVNSSYSFYWDVTRDWDLRYAQCLSYHALLIVSFEPTFFLTVDMQILLSVMILSQPNNFKNERNYFYFQK